MFFQMFQPTLNCVNMLWIGVGLDGHARGLSFRWRLAVLFIAVFLTEGILNDGSSNWLEGSLPSLPSLRSLGWDHGSLLHVSWTPNILEL